MVYMHVYRTWRHLSELTENLKKYEYSINIITNGIKKALKIPQNELGKPKEKRTDEVLSFISTFNPNNSSVYDAIKNSVEVRMRNIVPGSESIKLVTSKRQPPNLKKVLTWLKRNLAMKK